jgi:hypothetical protein
MPTLRVAAADRAPFVFIDAARSGNARFYGLLVDLLPVLLSYGAADGDRTTLEYYAVPPSGGELKNGTWTGSCDMLRYQHREHSVKRGYLLAFLVTALDQ